MCNLSLVRKVTSILTKGEEKLAIIFVLRKSIHDIHQTEKEWSRLGVGYKQQETIVKHEVTVRVHVTTTGNHIQVAI